MNRFWQILLGIDRTHGTEYGGDSRLDLTALPRGAGALAVLIAAVAVPFLVWWLYQRERRNLTAGKRALLVGLRLVVLLALAAMIAEPVLISSRRESVRSHLALVLDDSESMKFSDPYTDDSKAVEVASALGIRPRGSVRPPSGSGKPRGSTS